MNIVVEEKTVKLYPKPEKPLKPERHRWLNEYNLVYDFCIVEWQKSYRTKIGSRIAAWFHYYIASYGGGIKTTDRYLTSKT